MAAVAWACLAHGVMQNFSPCSLLDKALNHLQCAKWNKTELLQPEFVSCIFQKKILPFPVATNIGIFQIQRWSCPHPIAQEYDREANKGVQMKNHLSRKVAVRKDIYNTLTILYKW